LTLEKPSVSFNNPPDLGEKKEINICNRLNLKERATDATSGVCGKFALKRPEMTLRKV
jgi:hypothetical protein